VKNCELALRPSRCTAPVKRRLRRDRHSIKLDLPAPVLIHQGGEASDFSQQHVPELRMRALAYSPEGPRITVRSPVSMRPCTSQRNEVQGTFSFASLEYIWFLAHLPQGCSKCASCHCLGPHLGLQYSTPLRVARRLASMLPCILRRGWKRLLPRCPS
jgi:hypothetical protein